MVVPTYTLGCLRNKRIAQGIYEFALEKPEGFSFKAGQFVLFDIPLVDNPEDIQPRAFSIASSPSEEELLFVAKMIDGGRASAFIEKQLKEGVEILTKGPFGLFTLDEKNPKDYLFICTSTGVAPFRSQIIDACESGDTRRMDLVFGVRNEEDLFWKEECVRLSQQYENVFVHIALSGGSESWTGHKGRVQTLVPLIAKNMQEKNIYVCGNPAMTNEVKALCLNEWGVEKEDLHVEGYI